MGTQKPELIKCFRFERFDSSKSPKKRRSPTQKMCLLIINSRYRHCCVIYFYFWVTTAKACICHFQYWSANIQYELILASLIFWEVKTVDSHEWVIGIDCIYLFDLYLYRLVSLKISTFSYFSLMLSVFTRPSNLHPWFAFKWLRLVQLCVSMGRKLNN